MTNKSKPKFSLHRDHKSSDYLAMCERIASTADTWQDALNKLKGHDLIFAVHVVKSRFGITEQQIIDWIEGKV